MATLNDAIFSIVSNNAALSALITENSIVKCFPSFAPTSAHEPFIVYQTISDNNQRTMQGNSNTTRKRIQFSVFSFDVDTNKRIIKAIENCFDMVAINYAGIFDLSFALDNEIDNSDAPIDSSEQANYFSIADYMVWVKTL